MGGAINNVTRLVMHTDNKIDNRATNVLFVGVMVGFSLLVAAAIIAIIMTVSRHVEIRNSWEHVKGIVVAHSGWCSDDSTRRLLIEFSVEDTVYRDSVCVTYYYTDKYPVGYEVDVYYEKGNPSSNSIDL